MLHLRVIRTTWQGLNLKKGGLRRQDGFWFARVVRGGGRDRALQVHRRRRSTSNVVEEARLRLRHQHPQAQIREVHRPHPEGAEIETETVGEVPMMKLGKIDAVGDIPTKGRGGVTAEGEIPRTALVVVKKRKPENREEEENPKITPRRK